MTYRIRRYGSRWIVVGAKPRNWYRFHRHWLGAFLELLRLRRWL